MILNGMSPDDVDALLMSGGMLESLTTLIDVVGQIGSLEDLASKPSAGMESQLLARSEDGSAVTLVTTVGLPGDTPGDVLLRSLGDVAIELQSWPEGAVESTFLAIDVALGGPVKAVAGLIVDQGLAAVAGEELDAALDFLATEVYAAFAGIGTEKAEEEIAQGPANGPDSHWSRQFAGAKLLVAALVPAIVPAGKSIKDAVAPPKVGVAADARNAVRLQTQLRAEQIAGGHAFEKHILDRGEFAGLDIRTRAQFAEHVEFVMNNATDIKYLSNGRTGYWHEGTRTVVIHNPNDPDGGTAFQPDDGRLYFYDQLN